MKKLSELKLDDLSTLTDAEVEAYIEERRRELVAAKDAKQAELDALRTKLAAALDALSYYANEAHWRGHLEGGYGPDKKQTKYVTPAHLEKGRRARAALELIRK